MQVYITIELPIEEDLQDLIKNFINNVLNCLTLFLFSFIIVCKGGQKTNEQCEETKSVKRLDTTTIS
mgnify:CR=1 FL=1